MDNGVFGITISEKARALELSFDDNKIIRVVVREHDEELLEGFKTVAESYGLSQHDNLQLIDEGEHIHRASEEVQYQYIDFMAEIRQDARRTAQGNL